MAPAAVSDVLCSPWATVDDVSANQRAQVQSLTDQQVNDALMRASEILWGLSGRQWLGSGCTETAVLRSSPPPPGTQSWPYSQSWGSCACWRWGVWLDGALFPGPGFHGDHFAPVAVQLPRSPVTAVTAVTIDSVPFTDWRLARSGWLERTDRRPWNVCDDSTQIDYEFGQAPPAGGRDAAVVLGIELAKAMHGLDDCQLPQRTTSVTRQGITTVIMDPMEFQQKGKTGLTTVDMWLSTVNPQAVPQAGRVWSPDLPTSLRSP